jgi:phospholipid/cholesterol/gamma-HCH transport system substrate-binding protein
MNPSRSTEFRVGIFVTLALGIGSALIFALGNRSATFASKNDYTAVFSSVSGLRTGAPIRVSGMDVGTVGDLEFQEDGKVRVHLEIRQDVAALITGPRDAVTGDGASVATIGSKGLLGDMLVEVTPGSGEPLPAGAEIPARETGGMFSALARAGEIVDEIRPAIENVREFTEVLGDERFRRDLHDIAHNFAEVTRMVAEEDGTIPRLIRDEQLADRVESTLGSVQVATNELAATARNVRGITDEIRAGNGTAHEIIYGQEGTRLVTNLADTAGETATILRDVRTGDGNAHELLYGDSAGDLISNLTAITGDLRVVMAEVRSGRGTIGGLLMDPSIYEDIKRLVGNLERNDILRALVRYSIREDEPRDPAPRARPQRTVEQPIVTSQPSEDDPGQ